MILQKLLQGYSVTSGETIHLSGDNFINQNGEVCTDLDDWYYGQEPLTAPKAAKLLLAGKTLVSNNPNLVYKLSDSGLIVGPNGEYDGPLSELQVIE